MLKKVYPFILSLLFLLGTDAVAQPVGIPQSGDSGVVASIGTPADPAECLELDAQGNIISSGVACGAGGGGATQLTDLTDVTAKSGNSTTVVMGSGPFTSGDCVEFDANGNAIASGNPCSAAPATTEAALEAQLTDVTDVFTNNDGALTDDDLTDNVITDLSDVTAKSGNTTVVATTAGALTAGNCLQFDASGNIVGTGSACSAAPATTEAALEAQLSDVSDVFTNNDGALTDDDVSDDRPTDMLPAAHNTYLQGLDSLAAAVDLLKVDASDDTILNAKTGQEIQFAVNSVAGWNASASALIGQLATSQIHTDSNSNVLQIGAGSTTGGASGTAMYLYGSSSASPGRVEFQGDLGDSFNINFNNINLGANANAWSTSTADLIYSGGQILGDTADGADSDFLRMCSGGSFFASRGACLTLGGNESAFPGNLRYSTGLTGVHDFETGNNVDQWQIQADGNFVNQADNDIVVADEAYGVAWDASLEVPTKNAVYDKIETLGSGGVSITTGTEYLTGETLDGDLVYGKRIAIAAGPNNSTVTYAHGATFAYITKAYGTATDGGGNYFNLPYNRENAAGIQVFYDGTNISLYSPLNYAGVSGYVTIEYTK